MTAKFDFLKTALARPGKLTEEEEARLVEQYQNGDPQAYSKLRISLRPLMEKAISDAIPSGSEVSPFVLRTRAESLLPSILKKYDPSRGAKLNTFILSQLKGNLRNAVSENMSGAYVPRNQHTDLERLRQAERDARMEYGRNPTTEQIRSFYPEQEANKSFDTIMQYNVRNFQSDAVFGEDDEGEGLTFKDQFTTGYGVDSDELFASVYEDEQEQAIQQHFNPTEQDIIKRVTKEGQSFVQAALSTGTSTSDVRKTIRRWHELANN